MQYGKSLDWKKENYTTHDVASVFRRYLTHLPVRLARRVRAPLCSLFPPDAVADIRMFLSTQEPVIPYDLYFPVRTSRF